jgi:outer membrane protein assembly factor BamB
VLHEDLVIVNASVESKSLVALNKATGDVAWKTDGIKGCWNIGGRKNTAIAIRAGGRGDVTESHRLWVANAGSNVSSPIYHGGFLYWIHERQGTVNCLDAKDGKIVYQQRLEPRPGVSYASVVMAGNKLYCVSQHNGVFVIAAEPTFKLLSHNQIAGDEARANASPAVDRGQILLRNDKYLYCIGEPRGVL